MRLDDSVIYITVDKTVYYYIQGECRWRDLPISNGNNIRNVCASNISTQHATFNRNELLASRSFRPREWWAKKKKRGNAVVFQIDF